MVTQVVGSKMTTFVSDALKPSKAGYGQNGYGGASSDLPGENTKIGMLPECIPTNSDSYGAVDLYAGGRSGKAAPRAASKGVRAIAPQTRDVGKSGLGNTFGMKGAAKGPDIGSAPEFKDHTTMNVFKK